MKKTSIPWQVIPFVLFVALVLLFAFYITHQNITGATASQPLVGQAVPALELPVLGAKETFTQADFPKDRYTLINIFASWCVACVAEHPQLLALAKDKKMLLLGVAWHDKSEATQGYLKQHGNPYAKVLEDVKGVTGVTLAISGVPETLLVNPQGVIVARFAGPLSEDIWQELFAEHVQ